MVNDCTCKVPTISNHKEHDYYTSAVISVFILLYYYHEPNTLPLYSKGYKFITSKGIRTRDLCSNLLLSPLSCRCKQRHRYKT